MKTVSIATLIQIGSLLLFSSGSAGTEANFRIHDAPDGFHAMQSVEPFLEWVFPNVDWPRSAVAKPADEAFHDFLTNKDSEVLFTGRPLMPKDYVNAGCHCASEDCSEEVQEGSALIPCGEVRPFEFELTMDRIVLIANSANSKFHYVHTELHQYFSSNQPISCSEFGGDADEPISFYVPDEATATSFYFSNYLAGNVSQSIQPGQAISVEQSYDDILVKVSNNKCAIGIVPFAVAQGCKSSNKLSLPPQVCNNFQVVSMDDAPCRTCNSERIGSRGLDSPVLLYMNMNNIPNNTKVDALVKGIFEKAVDYHIALFEVSESHRDHLSLLNRKKGCKQINRYPDDQFPSPNLDNICEGQFLCCHNRDACDPDWYNENWYFNMTEMFWHSPCEKCRQQAAIDSLVKGLCTMRHLDCVNAIVTRCFPGEPEDQPITVCFFCGIPYDSAPHPICMATYVYMTEVFDCVDPDHPAFDPIALTPILPCAMGDCSNYDMDLSKVNSSLTCNQHNDV